MTMAISEKEKKQRTGCLGRLKSSWLGAAWRVVAPLSILLLSACLAGWRCVSIVLSSHFALSFKLHVFIYLGCVYVGVYLPWHMWRSEDKRDRALSLNMRSVSLGGLWLYPLSHLSGSIIVILKPLVICCLFLSLAFAFQAYPFL